MANNKANKKKFIKIVLIGYYSLAGLILQRKGCGNNRKLNVFSNLKNTMSTQMMHDITFFFRGNCIECTAIIECTLLKIPSENTDVIVKCKLKMYVLKSMLVTKKTSKR